MELPRQLDKEACSTWLEIDLNALRNNLALLQKIAERPIMPVVKANAYGHGLIEISRAAESFGITWLGVARIEEALSLRAAGIRCHILVLGFTPIKRVADAIAEDISLTIYDWRVAEQYALAANATGGVVKVHLKVDSGMGRLGVFPGDANEFVTWVKQQKSLSLEAVFTHFACADEPQKSVTKEQISKFDLFLTSLEKEGLKPGFVHASNSAATMNNPEGRYDMERCGIAMYGLQPSPTTPLPPDFKPVLTWKTHLVSLKILPPAHGVSYGFHYFTKKNERIGVIAIGYADGYRRIDGNVVLIRGRRVPVVGNVCMDQCMLQLDEVPDASIGDEVVLIGRQGNDEINVSEISKDWGTINYEVICGLAERVPRFYINP